MNAVPTVYIVMTDFGPIRLSDRTVRWLRMQDPDWAELIANKRARSKKAKWLRDSIRQLEVAVTMHAKISWALQEDPPVQEF